MVKIKTLKSFSALDSRGLPAIKTIAQLTDGSIGEAVVSGNTNNGKYSALMSKDTGNESGSFAAISQAIDKVEYIIAPKLTDYKAENQEDLDAVLFELDGTQNKSRLGANTTLSISIAFARAVSKSQNLPLYKYILAGIKSENSALRLPKIINSLISGGPDCENLLDFKDFLVVPSVYKTVKESLTTAALLNNKLKNTFRNKKIPVIYSIEGGCILSLPDNKIVFEIFDEAFGSINLKLGYDFFWGIDVNADNLFNGEHYVFKNNPIPSLSSSDLVSFYLDIIRNHHVFYIEDPFASDDPQGWAGLNTRTSEDTIITGDFLISGSPARLQSAISQKLISGVSLNPIQNGTITESILAATIARLSGIKIIIHQPPGSACDNYISDIAVAVNADYVNFGSLNRGENVLNYNRLLEIESELENK